MMRSLHLTRNLSHVAQIKPFEEICSPPGGSLPLFGHGPLLVKKPHGIRYIWKNLMELQEKYADPGDRLLRLNVPVMNLEGQGRLLFIFNPEDIATVYRNDGRIPFRGDTILSCLKALRQRSPEVFTQYTGLITDNGEKWLELRAKVQKVMMKPDSALFYINDIQDIAFDMVNHIKQHRKSGKIEDFLHVAHLFALEVMLRITLKNQNGCLIKNDHGPEFTKFISSTEKMLFNFGDLLTTVPIWNFQWLPPRLSRAFRSLEDEFKVIKQFAIKKINQAKKDLQIGSKKDKNMSLLEKLIVQNEPNSCIPYVMAFDAIAGGVDTVASSLAFLAYNLSRNPDKQERLRKEIAQFGTKHVSREDLSKMKYLRACIKESFRLTPTVSFGGRMLHKDLTLQGYTIPAKTMMIWNWLIIGRDETLFPDPEKFCPERWIEKKNIHPFSVLQFGHGPRSCIGRRFAELELQLAVVKLLQNFSFNSPEVNDLEIKFELLMATTKPITLQFNDIA